MSFRLWIRREAIAWATWRLSPTRISLSNPDKVRQRNFATTYLGDRDGDTHYLVYYLNTRGAVVRDVPVNENSRDAIIANDDLLDHTFEVTQYFRQIEVRYDNDLEYVIHRYIGAIYFYYAFDVLAGTFYALGRMPRLDRMRVLRTVADSTIDGGQSRFSEISLPTQLHGMRWARHSDSEKLQRYYRLILESLAETQDLRLVNGSYELHAKGLATLAEFDAENRRHRQNHATQLVLAVLTAVLIIVGLGQVFSDLLNGDRTHSIVERAMPWLAEDGGAAE